MSFNSYVLDIRLGLILEELDSMAGKISYRHAVNLSPEAKVIVDQLLAAKGRLDPKDLAKANVEIPIYIVTASCNRIELYDKIEVESDLIIEGLVTWVGRSSMVSFNDIIQLISTGSSYHR